MSTKQDLTTGLAEELKLHWFCGHQIWKPGPNPSSSSGQDRLSPSLVLTSLKCFLLYTSASLCIFTSQAVDQPSHSTHAFGLLSLLINVTYAWLLMVPASLCLSLYQFLLLMPTEISSLKNLIVQIPNRENLIGLAHHSHLCWERICKSDDLIDCLSWVIQLWEKEFPIEGSPWLQLCTCSAASLCLDWKLPKGKAWTWGLCYSLLYPPRIFLRTM